MEFYEDISDRKHSLKVASYNSNLQAHECFTENGTRVLVDLFIDGSFEGDVRPNDLIGKVVEVNWSHAHIWIAHGVKLKEGE